MPLFLSWHVLWLSQRSTRSKIDSLIFADSGINKMQGYIYNCLWKFMDFWSGINDIRDTHAAVSFESLFPFFAGSRLDSFI